ncbi:MAG: sigma-70 family RNA polymerase sigma factor [Flavobacteriaceae bacterium]|nr:sigma-70 family RNA polymerase sigma factor [Flavobacteriaceae bacterium]
MKQSEFIAKVMPFKDKVFRLAKRLLVSTEEAEDATQELYYKLWKNKEKVSEYKSVEAFAMTMTKNYCLDRLKSKQAGNLRLVHDNYEENNVGLSKRLDDEDSVNKIHEMIKCLPEQQRIIVQLRDVEQYEFEEIGKILNMQPTAIRVALSRARKTLREGLVKFHNYGVS